MYYTIHYEPNTLPPATTTTPKAALEPLLPLPKPGGRLIKYSRREIVNAILYILRTGAWRMLPHDLRRYRIVFHYYRAWQQDGVRRQGTQHCASKPSSARGVIPNPAPPLCTASRW